MALSTTHTFALHKINEKEYIKVFKKVKKILPILLAMVMLFGGCLTVCAEESTTSETPVYYPLPFKSSDYSCYFIRYYGGKSHFLLCALSNGKFALNDDGYLCCTENCTYTYYDYVVGSDKGWSRSSTGTWSAEQSIMKFGNDLLECNKNIYDSSGKLVFRAPVPLAAVAEVLPETIQNQTGVILTIAIGLLASLTILSVLPKKLPLFLKR